MLILPLLNCDAGKTATHAIVYAQLYTPDGQHHGLNGFLVPIRSTKTLEPFAGVIVGDLGEKIGLNGLDNGFVSFTNYRIPKHFLLSRTGDISDDGQYISPIKNNKKRIGASFGALSGGRVNICGKSRFLYDGKNGEFGVNNIVACKFNFFQEFQLFT